MDIDKLNFPARLLDIIVALSESSFVSFDLELSGVPMKPSGPGSGKATLQDRYLEVKKAAEQFQILQIGLTCVKEDAASGKYSCRPYNFHLSPLCEEKVDIERTFAFSSGAVDFLLKVGFQLSVPFEWGVPYLSRDETELAKQRSAARHDRSSFSDMVIKPEDADSLALMRRLRAEIDKWKSHSDYINDSLLLEPALLREPGAVDAELSRFEKRLVHQLVRSEYPDLVTVPQRGSIMVTIYDQEREDYVKKQRIKQDKERIYRQVGFRWLVEAISGGDLSKIDLRYFAKDSKTGAAIFVDLADVKARFHRARSLLRDKPRVLVGHNMFLDLIYLYRTFIGELPATVEEFAGLIHQLFPLIVDTKYLATHNCGDISPASSLEEIDRQLAEQETPVIEGHPDHGKYDGTAAFHEAGYDSMLTAHVAVRLSAKLEAEGQYLHSKQAVSDPMPCDQLTPPEHDGGVKLNAAATDFTPEQLRPSAVDPTVQTGWLNDVVLAPVKVVNGSGRQADGRPPQPTQGKAQSAKPSRSSFAHRNTFEHLENADENDEDEEVLHYDDLLSATAPDTDGRLSAAEVGYDYTGLDPWAVEPTKSEPMRLMPRFDSEFWKAYGNKLRVFGTHEAVCVLDNST